MSTLEIVLTFFSTLTLIGSVIVLIIDIRKTKKFISKGASWVHQLRGIHANAMSAMDHDDGMALARQANSTLVDIEEYCRGFKSYRKNEKIQIKQQKDVADLHSRNS